MSIDVPNELLTASSGSAGDTVFSRNQHGPYTRARVTPTDPGSALQLAVRAALSECVTAWRTTLTAVERSRWDDFALAVRTRTALGRSTNAGGLGMYIRANVPRIQAAEPSLPRVDQAPALHTSAPFTPITPVVLNIIDDTIHPFFDDSDPWVTDTGAAMLFYASAPQPLQVHFWKGPYRYAGPLLGSDPALSSPGTIPLPFPARNNQRVFVRARLTLPDARTSEPFRLPADIAPQVRPQFTGAVISFIPFDTVVLTVSFDQLLRVQTHDPDYWIFRFDNRLHFPTTAVTDRDTIVLTAPGGIINFGVNTVRYNPTIPDVYGLITGIAVLTFAEAY